MLRKKPKIVSDWKRQLRSYSAIGLLANILIALAFGISMGFGIISAQVGAPVFVAVFLLVSGLGFVGKFLKQWDKDEDE